MKTSLRVSLTRNRFVDPPRTSDLQPLSPSPSLPIIPPRYPRNHVSHRALHRLSVLDISSDVCLTRFAVGIAQQPRNDDTLAEQSGDASLTTRNKAHERCFRNPLTSSMRDTFTEL